MGTETLLAFLAVAALAYVTPAPDWFVVMRHAATSRRASWVAAAGVQCGLLVHMTAAAIGVAALLLASAEAFTVLKIAGAAYLIYLGLRSLKDSFGRRPDDKDDAGEVAIGRVWRQLLDVALGAVWWAVFVLGVRAVRSALGGRRSRVVIDRVAGTSLVGLGGVLAVSGRQAA